MSISESQTQTQVERLVLARFPEDHEFTAWRWHDTWWDLLRLVRFGTPIIVMGERRLVSGSIFTSFRNRSLQLFLRVLLISLVLVTVLSLFNYAQSRQNNTYSNEHELLYYSINVSLGVIGAGLLLLSIVADGVLDVRVINLAHSPIHRDKPIVVKHATVQIHAWSIVSVVMSLRVVSVIILVISLVLTQLYYFGNPNLNIMSSAINNIMREGFTARSIVHILTGILNAIVTGWTLLIYLIEPLWRYHTMTALGLAKGDNRNILSTVFSVWVSQIVILLALAGLTFFSLDIPFISYYSNMDMYGIEFEGYVASVAGLVLGGVIYVYYWWLRRNSLNKI